MSRSMGQFLPRDPWRSLLRLASKHWSHPNLKQAAQPPDEVTEKYWRLVCQDRAFIAARAAIRSGGEIAAGVTATGRTGSHGAK
jgi:hypothetical protein